MKVTPDIIRHEFIGANAQVAKSLHEDYVGLTGRVIGETRNTFTLLDEGKAKNVIKELLMVVINPNKKNKKTITINGNKYLFLF